MRVILESASPRQRRTIGWKLKVELFGIAKERSNTTQKLKGKKISIQAM
jgi:hypothetical protein